MGALLGGPYSTLLTFGTKMGNTETTPKFKESSAFGDSNKGFSSEAPQIGAAGQSTVGSGCGDSSALGDSDKGYLSEALQMGAAERGPVERESPVRGTPARILQRALVKGKSSAWGLRKKRGNWAGFMPVGLGEAPIFWGQHPSPSNLQLENLEVLAEKFSTLGPR